MKRTGWKFTYGAEQLAKAAQLQADHRNERVAWWKGQRETVMEEVRSSGVEVSESLAMGYNNTSAAFGPTVTVRADLQKKLQECHTKIQAHEAAAREYEGWVQVLSANPASQMTLHHDDWLYFFGK